MAVRGIKGETDRLRLEEHIPLETPLHVFIDASSACNFHCQFCPHGSGETRTALQQSIMPVSLAKKCIDDLCAFSKKIKRLSFSAEGEPLVNKNLPEIIEYAAHRNVAECLNITTNASLLTPALSDELIKAGLNHIDISIYGLNSEKYHEFSDAKVSFEVIVKNIAYLYSIKSTAQIVIKISDAICSTESDQEIFYRMFSSICDKVCVEHAVPFWYDMNNGTKDDDKDIYGKTIQKKLVCPIPFFSICVQANGVVTPCCVDWKQRLPMGDAKIESLFSIWNSEKYRLLYRKLLQYGNKGVTPCDFCRYHELVALDNIDDFRTDLLKKLEEKDAL